MCGRIRQESVIHKIRNRQIILYCDLDLGDMTLNQELCEILSRSNKGLRSYVLDTM